MPIVRALSALPRWTFPLICAVVALFVSQFGLDLNAQRQFALICILALAVSGLNLSLGYAGELALGGAAVYAVGAYVTGYLGTHGYSDIVLQLVASAAAALLVGLITGIPGLRLGGWSLAMTSFFLILLVPDLLAIFSNQTGGLSGLAGIAFPTLFGSLLSQSGYYLVVTIVLILWMILFRNLVTSRHGPAFRTLRQSPVLAASNGMSVYRMKLTAYALGSVPAGLAGSLFANLDHYLSPTTFDYSLVITILAASILGGAASVYGALVGAAIMQLGPLGSTSFLNYSLVVFGVFLIVGGALLSEGLAGIARRSVRLIARSLAPRLPEMAGHVQWIQSAGPAGPAAESGQPETVEPDAARALAPIHGAPLTVQGVSKHFGGNIALNDVSLTARPGCVTALIGPNGSGKTTLLNVICSFYRRDNGIVMVGGEVTGSRPHLVARAGVARTFQTPIIPAGLTVLEAVAAGRYMAPYSSLLSSVLRLPPYRRVAAEDRGAAMEVLELVGMAGLAGTVAGAMPLGMRRLLEIARSLVTRPKVLLLDEVASGLDEHELRILVALIRRIRDAGGTVVLVEHNFKLILSLADHVYVLAQGQVVADGPPQEIEHHPAVLREYLGVTVDEAIEKTFEELAAVPMEEE